MFRCTYSSVLFFVDFVIIANSLKWIGDLVLRDNLFYKFSLYHMLIHFRIWMLDKINIILLLLCCLGTKFSSNYFEKSLIFRKQTKNYRYIHKMNNMSILSKFIYLQILSSEAIERRRLNDVDGENYTVNQCIQIFASKHLLNGIDDRCVNTYTHTITHPSPHRHTQPKTHY